MNRMSTSRGFALIEVLVAMFVLAIGILGAGAMQTIGLQANQGAALRAQAMYLASDMMDRIRANRSARATYIGVDTDSATYTAMAAPSCETASSGCSAANIATADIVDWVDQIERNNFLPGGRGEIQAVTGAGDNIRITISWGETSWNAGARSNVTMTYDIVAAVNPLTN